MERQLDLLGREIASAMSQSISNAILVDDRFSMTEQLIHARQTNEQIRYIVVDGPEGTMLASTFTEGVPLGFPKRNLSPGSADEDWVIDSNEGTIREIVYPIDKGLVGYIRIGMTETVMIQIMEKRLVETMTFIFIICIVASVLATRFARNFLLPIRRLDQAARQIGKGDYSVRVPRTSSDDIGRLGRTFNVMVNRLAAKMRKIPSSSKPCRKRNRPVSGLLTGFLQLVKMNGDAFPGNFMMNRVSPWFLS